MLDPSKVNQPLIEPWNQPSHDSWRWPWKDPVKEHRLKERLKRHLQFLEEAPQAPEAYTCAPALL